MIESLRQWLPGWAFALILMVLTAALAAVTAWIATGDGWAVAVAVLSSVLGVGAVGAKALTKGAQPPSDPTATAPVTP
jgi:F0F1-type ATP synthase membrane subunit c/vacuolar-type H+-ATPase subunit K